MSGLKTDAMDALLAASAGPPAPDHMEPTTSAAVLRWAPLSVTRAVCGSIEAAAEGGLVPLSLAPEFGVAPAGAALNAAAIVGVDLNDALGRHRGQCQRTTTMLLASEHVRSRRRGGRAPAPTARQGTTSAASVAPGTTLPAAGPDGASPALGRSSSSGRSRRARLCHVDAESCVFGCRRGVGRGTAPEGSARSRQPRTLVVNGPGGPM